MGLLSFCCLCCAAFLFLECLLVAESLVSWIRLPARMGERSGVLAAAGIALTAVYVLATVPFLYGELIPDNRKL